MFTHTLRRETVKPHGGTRAAQRPYLINNCTTTTTTASTEASGTVREQLFCVLIVSRRGSSLSQPAAESVGAQTDYIFNTVLGLRLYCIVTSLWALPQSARSSFTSIVWKYISQFSPGLLLLKVSSE